MDTDEDSGNSLGLKIMFGLLFMIFIGEIMYFFILPSKKPFIPITPIIPTFAPLTPTPMPTKIPTKIPTSTKTPPLTQEFQGKIIKIVEGLDKTLSTGFKPELILSIETEVNKPIPTSKFNFAFGAKDLANLKIVDSTGKAVSYKVLRVGQNIKITNTNDFDYSSNFSVRIIILD